MWWRLNVDLRNEENSVLIISVYVTQLHEYYFSPSFWLQKEPWFPCINHGPHTFSTIGFVLNASSVTHAASARRVALLLDLFWPKMQMWMESSQKTVRGRPMIQLRCRCRDDKDPIITCSFLSCGHLRQHKSFSAAENVYLFSLHVLSVSKVDLGEPGMDCW